MVKGDSGLVDNLSTQLDANAFERKLKMFLDQYGDLTTGVTGGRSASGELSAMTRFITELARHSRTVANDAGL